MKIRVSLWGWIFWGSLFVVLCTLGSWQVQRHLWKQELKAEIAARMSDAPLHLPAANPPEYRRASVRGTLQADKAVFLAAREINSSAIGYQVLSPLQLADGSWLLINRGWLPPEARTQPLPATNIPPTLEGLIRKPPAERANPFIPDNQPQDNHWYWLDLPAMQQYLGLDTLRPYILELTQNANTGPKPGQTRLELPDNHRTYAAIWFILAAILIVFFIALHRQKETT